jgi:hypothetical protein
MTMISRAFAALAVAAVLVLSAAAFAGDTPAPEISGPRYSFHKVADGFLRLDSQSGEVALCSSQPVGWACLAAPEDRAVLENEIARLRKENATLKVDILSRGLPLPRGVMPEAPVNDNDKNLTFRLPDNSDLDRVIALFGRVWHRLVEAIANVQNQVLHRS